MKGNICLLSGLCLFVVFFSSSSAVRTSSEASHFQCFRQRKDNVHRRRLFLTLDIPNWFGDKLDSSWFRLSAHRGLRYFETMRDHPNLMISPHL